MSANSILLHFFLHPATVSDLETSFKCVIRQVKSNVEKVFGRLEIICETSLDDGFLSLTTNNVGIIFTLRAFKESLVTLNIEYLSSGAQQEAIYFTVSQEQSTDIQKKFVILHNSKTLN